MCQSGTDSSNQSLLHTLSSFEVSSLDGRELSQEFILGFFASGESLDDTFRKVKAAKMVRFKGRDFEIENVETSKLYSRSHS